MTEGKVIRYILCKLDDREYIPGDTYEGTPERINELAKLGYLQKAPAAPASAGGGAESEDDDDAEESEGKEDLEENSTPEKKTQRSKRGSANGAAAD